MNLRKILFPIFALTALSAFAAGKGSITVKLSNFISPELTHSQSIGKCLRATNGYAKRTIVFDVPLLEIDSVILLESNTTIKLKRCTIKQKDYMFDNVFRGANVPLTTGAFDEIPDDVRPLQNIRIVGDGKSRIMGCKRHRMYNYPDRPGKNKGWQEMTGDYYGARTHLINFSMTDGFELGGINFAKTNGWCISFDLCRHIKVHDLDFQTNVKNGDGIDFRCGCKYFKVWNISGNTSDDIVACTALGETEWNRLDQTPESRFVSSYTRKMWGHIKETDPEALHIEHGSIKNITSTGTHHLGWGHAVICLSAYGSQVRYIDIKNVHEGKGGVVRESLVKIYTGYGSGYTPGDLNHIRVANVTANTARMTVQSNAKCSDMEIKNIKHSDPSKKAISLKYKEGFKVK